MAVGSKVCSVPLRERMPTQDERYRYDERGLLETKIVVRRDEGGNVLSGITR